MDRTNNIMEGIETTTWHDQRPSHPPVPKAVQIAEVHAKIARNEYNAYIDYGEDSGDGCDEDELEYLRCRANQTDEDLRLAREADRRTWSDDPKYWGGMNDD